VVEAVGLLEDFNGLLVARAKNLVCHMLGRLIATDDDHLTHVNADSGLASDTRIGLCPAPLGIRDLDAETAVAELLHDATEDGVVDVDNELVELFILVLCGAVGLLETFTHLDFELVEIVQVYNTTTSSILHDVIQLVNVVPHVQVLLESVWVPAIHHEFFLTLVHLHLLDGLFCLVEFLQVRKPALD